MEFEDVSDVEGAKQTPQSDSGVNELAGSSEDCSVQGKHVGTQFNQGVQSEQRNGWTIPAILQVTITAMILIISASALAITFAKRDGKVHLATN